MASPAPIGGRDQSTPATRCHAREPNRPGHLALPIDRRRPLTNHRGQAGTITGLAIGLHVLGLLVSAVVVIGLNAAVIPPSATAHYLWAGVTGGTISADEVTRYQIDWQIRTPGVLLAAWVGAGSALSGLPSKCWCATLSRTVNAGCLLGASVGAVAVTVSGGLAAAVYAVSREPLSERWRPPRWLFLASWTRAGLAPLRLVLTGVVMSFGFQSLMAMIVYFSPDSKATSTLLFWSMGDFGAVTWGRCPRVAAVVFAGIVLLARQGRTLDVMTFGDERECVDFGSVSHSVVTEGAGQLSRIRWRRKAKPARPYITNPFTGLRRTAGHRCGYGVEPNLDGSGVPFTGLRRPVTVAGKCPTGLRTSTRRPPWPAHPGRPPFRARGLLPDQPGSHRRHRPTPASPRCGGYSPAHPEISRSLHLPRTGLRCRAPVSPV
ncbi:iron chelate uptake ABC transporter family permease subunit [Verrucosispora sp. WMMA2121]|uniref:iron chelate uptake ABC transporter family permease subunit n=1 Tax=Verrucosispora sp. WMMA2121 TaxID=3015164 RepID=UPI003FCE7CF6